MANFTTGNSNVSSFDGSVSFGQNASEDVDVRLRRGQPNIITFTLTLQPSEQVRLSSKGVRLVGISDGLITNRNRAPQNYRFDVDFGEITVDNINNFRYVSVDVLDLQAETGPTVIGIGGDENTGVSQTAPGNFQLGPGRPLIPIPENTFPGSDTGIDTGRGNSGSGPDPFSPTNNNDFPTLDTENIR